MAVPLLVEVFSIQAAASGRREYLVRSLVKRACGRIFRLEEGEETLGRERKQGSWRATP
jgi:hypothetical protein